MASDDIVIRPAEPSDLDEVAAVLRACVGDMQARGIDQWDDVYPTRATLADDIAGGRLRVVTRAGAVVGAVALDDRQEPQYADVEWQIRAAPAAVTVVHRLMVHPRAQRRGLGRTLMTFAEDEARARGCRAVRLDAFAGNARALDLYAGLGYRDAGAVRFRKGIFRCFEKDLGDATARAAGAGVTSGPAARGSAGS